MRTNTPSGSELDAFPLVSGARRIRTSTPPRSGRVRAATRVSEASTWTTGVALVTVRDAPVREVREDQPSSPPFVGNGLANREERQRSRRIYPALAQFSGARNRIRTCTPPRGPAGLSRDANVRCVRVNDGRRSDQRFRDPPVREVRPDRLSSPPFVSNGLATLCRAIDQIHAGAHEASARA